MEQRSILVQPATGAGGLPERPRRALSDAQKQAQRVKGQARARQGMRDAHGRFISRADQEQAEEAYREWLYAVPGRAGGVARADSGRRDCFGCFAR